MAEVIALGASIIAVGQLADRVIEICKYYIKTVRDAPSDLRKILIEISTLKIIFQELEFLTICDSELSASLQSLTGVDGPIGGCRQAVADLDKLLPVESVYTDGSSKRRKVKATLTSLAWPLKEDKAKRLLQDISRHKTTITLALTSDSTRDIKDIKSRTTDIHNILTESQRQDVYRWLQATDPSPIHYRACEQYEAKTGDWVLRSPEWKNWIECKHRCLWIHGIPGAGKTVLASHLIKSIESYCKTLLEKRSAYVYYYCYFGHNQDEATPFLRWVINQLCRKADSVPNCIHDMFRYGGSPSLADLMDALESILAASFDVVYITLDAIDESMPRVDLLKLLRDLATDHLFKKIQLLTTSREYFDIERVMEVVSVEVSMSNPLVDEDIKTYVQSQLHTLPKFKKWPPHLLDEAEKALMLKAKGMFRWAVCQIDVLQHLKPKSHAILDALANLPKTLDETYERIFLGIPSDHRLFALHVLKWICYYNERRVYLPGNLPCSIILQAVERSTSHLTSSRHDFLYDEDVLRELCGCLIVITREKLFEYGNVAALTVTFAHYTVLEFLQSARVFNSSVAFFAIDEESTAIDFTRITILEALDIGPNRLDDISYFNNDDAIGDFIAQDFSSYCAASSILSINSWTYHLNSQDDLVTLVFDLMNPSKPHFNSLCYSLQILDNSKKFFLYNKVNSYGQFWNTRWIVPPPSVDAMILFGLPGRKGSEMLLTTFLNGVNAEDFFKGELVLETTFFDSTCVHDELRSYFVKGTIIDTIAQICGYRYGFDILFTLLLDLGRGLFNASNTLVSYIGSHKCFSGGHRCENACPLLKLLELGAQPNALGYQVKPLQIAVVSWDLQGVRILLEAGTDPNDSGDREGVIWDKKDLLGRFNHLGGCSPLYICREFKCVDYFYNEDTQKKRDRDEIEKLLVYHGAKSFKEEWACEVVDEEDGSVSQYESDESDASSDYEQ